VQRDRKRREATLHRIQQLVHEQAMFAPIYDVATLNGYGPRVAEPGLGLIAGYLFSAPYEDLKLTGSVTRRSLAFRDLLSAIFKRALRDGGAP
jgi:peptide/nickel transport system substrate-binding protein